MFPYRTKLFPWEGKPFSNSLMTLLKSFFYYGNTFFFGEVVEHISYKYIEVQETLILRTRKIFSYSENIFLVLFPAPNYSAMLELFALGARKQVFLTKI